MQHTGALSLVLLLSALLLVDAQVPPRLNIPGAVPLPIARSQFRNEKLVRVRRPIALRSQDLNVPAVTPRALEDPKPVTELEDDEIPDVFLPQLLREQQLAQAQQDQFHQTAAQFFNNEPNTLQEQLPTHINSHEEQAPHRPTPTAVVNSRPQFNDYGIGANFGSQRAQAVQPPPAVSRPNVIRSRPREPRPQYDQQPAAERNAPQAVSRPRPKPIQSRPIEQNIVGEEREAQPKRQRPVSQTLRKWREENEDGSITWGYENDDGSFKEELIGTDCVTKGTYGYIDPDGNKREYHYETGIKCDPDTRQTEQELQENGFINYEENKAVLPNGIEIDMSQIGKKKSRRPGAAVAQQAPQNQYYRN